MHGSILPGRWIAPLVASAFANAFISSPIFAEAIELRQPGVVLHVDDWDDVEIRDESNRTLLTLTGFHAKWNPDAAMVGGTVHAVTTPEGRPAVEVRYEAAESSESPLQVVGRFVPMPGRVDVRFDLTNVPIDKDTRLGGSMFGRVFPRNAREVGFTKLGRWTRDPHGGVPYEVKDGVLMRYRVGDRMVSFAFGSGNGVNVQWKDGHQQHTGVSRVAPGHYKTEFSVLVAPVDWSAEALAARWHDRPVALTLSTPKLYNWWTDASEPLAVDATIVNASQEAREVEVAHWVRDFDGEVLSQATRPVTLGPGQVYVEPIRFTPSASRGIFFTEVSVTDSEGAEEAFARTNLALLPPHEFHSTPEDSIFGIAAYWPIPTEEDVQRLMDRMGVRWVRSGDTRKQHPGRIANHHSNIKWNREWTDEERDAWIRKQLALCVEKQTPYWEFANEINMSTAGIAMEGHGIGKALLADKYVDWLRAIRRVQEETGTTHIKILSFGIAGMDVAFVNKMYELGAWDLIDGLALHPGRGNFTPDYPVSEPYEEWVVGSHGNYWNYYGSIRTAMSLLKQYGEKPLWLTEVYTPTFPNSFWEDTPRNAAENVVLSYALAKAEGVKAAMYYQMFDSVWWDRLGVNPKDREYFFGLVQRDLSFKPSLLAYCAIAEALDQATFDGWLKFPDPQTRGLLFSTPRGPLAVLWNRADGYVLTEKANPFITPEPWIDTWKTKAPTRLPAAGVVTVINSIGQSREVPAANGSVILSLDGAPRLVYGLDADRLRRMLDR